MSALANEAVKVKDGKEPSKRRRSIHEFGIGTTTRRLFNDGNWYTARVMSEPRRIFDVEKRKFVLSRKIKYYADGQEEWADEDQLNDWAYDAGAKEMKEIEQELESSSHGRVDGDIWCADDQSDNNDEEEVEYKQCLHSARATADSALRSSRKRRKSTETTIVTPPPSEITPRSLYSPDGNKLSAAPSEMTGSSVAESCDDPSDDGRRRSKRAKKQPETFVASAKLAKPPPSKDSSGRKNPGVVKKAKAEIRQILMYKMGITIEEIDYALDKMTPPYGQNQAIHIIQTRRQELGNLLQEEENTSTEKFHPHIGMRVRVPEGGSNYHGTVTEGPKWLIPEHSKKEVKMWTVTFDEDQQKEDYDFQELFRYRASRPVVKFEGCRGRTLNALELFCGEGIVTQAFSKREFNVRSIDVDPDSYAMMVLDILKAKYEDIGFVPDFIWASPPCTTCSYLAGGKHRNAKEGQFEKTQTAHDHNLLFAQMICIMRWVKSKNPHLIVVIENPQAQMQKLPMMLEFEKSFGLFKATVDYCAFERPDKKPTNLWTNVSFGSLLPISVVLNLKAAHSVDS